MDLQDYMDRLEERYTNPYIQVPRKMIGELTEDFSKASSESYVGYGYSFLIVNAFLYKYVHYVDMETDEYLTLKDIKKMLKYNPNNQNLNKISKRKDGLLEFNAFVESTRDIPVAVTLENREGRSVDFRNIHRLSEIDDETRNHILYDVIRTSAHHVYVPEFMKDYPAKLGTLNDYRDTYKLTYKEFSYFIFDEDMDLRDFLLYCYIKDTRNFYTGVSKFTYEQARENTGMSHATVRKIADKLEELGVISVERNLNESLYKKKSNTYTIKDSFESSMQYPKRQYSKSDSKSTVKS